MCTTKISSKSFKEATREVVARVLSRTPRLQRLGLRKCALVTQLNLINEGNDEIVESEKFQERVTVKVDAFQSIRHLDLSFTKSEIISIRLGMR